MQRSRYRGRDTAGARHLENRSLETRITDLTIKLGVIGLLAYWSLRLIAPFVTIAVWAVILAVALYPVFAALRKLLGGHGGLSAALISATGLLIIVGPLGVVAINSVDAAQDFFARVSDRTIVVPTPPEAVRDWPIFGEQIHAAWSLASANLDDSVKRFGPQLLQAGRALLGRIAGISFGLLGLALSMLLAGFLFGPGPRLAEGARRFARRIAPDQGARFVDLAGATIRSISRGVIGVALLQALLVGLILTAFDLAAAGIIALAVLVLCIVQVGPVPALLPVMLWAWTAMGSGQALILTLLLVPIVVIDNVLKPIVMARGLSTPLLVILVGVVGGTLSYGLVGLFLGPIVLGVLYELLMAWAKTEPQTPPRAGAI